jgi:hypothetical protein
MKNCKNISGTLLGKIGAAGLLCFLLTSCLKENNSTNYTPPTSLISFIQASPDEPPLDFYLNSNKVNQGVIYYGNYINYVSAYAGTRTANFYTSGTMNLLLSGTITLNPNTAYSLFLGDIPTNPQILMLTDTLIKPTAGNASVRFVNLSPDAPAVDLAIQGGAVLVHNISNKGYSTFIPVPVNAGYTFEVRQAGTGTVLATLTNVPLVNGSVYTIWFGGLVASTNNTDRLSVNIYTNAFFL